MTGFVFSKVHTIDAKRTEDSPLEIFLRSKMASQQFSSENFRENLEFTRAVHEGFPGRSNCFQCDAVPVTIGDPSAMKSEYGFDASGKAQEVANGDTLLVRFIGPLGDRIPHRFIQIQDTVLLSGDGSQAPEPFGTAENRDRLVPAIAIRIRLVENLIILNHQQRQASVRHRVLLCRRASGHRDLSVRGSENEPTGSQKQQRTNHSHEAATTTVADTKSKKLLKVLGRDELPVVLVRRTSSASRKPDERKLVITTAV